MTWTKSGEKAFLRFTRSFGSKTSFHSKYRSCHSKSIQIIRSLFNETIQKKVLNEKSVTILFTFVLKRTILLSRAIKEYLCSFICKMCEYTTGNCVQLDPLDVHCTVRMCRNWQFWKLLFYSLILHQLCHVCIHPLWIFSNMFTVEYWKF